ncbi:phospholipase B1, membrane-associated [Protopterus annectens]|uniref:phospholipase B1, membrane-associated n=1 Tax=Protopterus annectens TaxID=7888 RepID=UPI001CFA3233|nr:phospholipase B1, membrane-associated [Protopterus annectens]
MMEPVGEKSTNESIDVVIELKCPQQEKPYLFTKKNSESTKESTIAPISTKPGPTSVLPGTTPLPPASGIPSWAVAVAAVAGVLLGIAASVAFLSCKKQYFKKKYDKQEKKEKNIDQNMTSF